MICAARLLSAASVEAICRLSRKASGEVTRKLDPNWIGEGAHAFFPMEAEVEEGSDPYISVRSLDH